MTPLTEVSKSHSVGRWPGMARCRCRAGGVCPDRGLPMLRCIASCSPACGSTRALRTTTSAGSRRARPGAKSSVASNAMRPARSSNWSNSYGQHPAHRGCESACETTKPHRSAPRGLLREVGYARFGRRFMRSAPPVMLSGVLLIPRSHPSCKGTAPSRHARATLVRWSWQRKGPNRLAQLVP